jgi:glycosyltransferase involved in cell wall biosynthesis
MKVLIDISPLQNMHKTRGIGMYTKQLGEYLPIIDSENQYILTSKSQYISDADLIHYPYFDLFFHTLPMKKKAKTVVTIHDVIPLVFPKLHPPGIKGSISYIMQKIALSSVDAIITDSENSKRDIIKHLKTEKNKIVVIPLASASIFKKLSLSSIKNIKIKYQLPDNFFLYVGDVNPTKNIIGLLQAFSIFMKKNIDYDLVLVGRALGLKSKEVQDIKSKINQLGLNSRVHLHSKVPLDPPSDLVAIYNLSKWYIQPSIYEGFGLPVLEAFATSTPVICSNSSSLPEVTGNAVLKFDPNSEEDIAGTMVKAINLKDEARNRYIKLGNERLKQYSWEKTAKMTLAVYKSVLSGN